MTFTNPQGMNWWRSPLNRVGTLARILWR